MRKGRVHRGETWCYSTYQISEVVACLPTHQSYRVAEPRDVAGGGKEMETQGGEEERERVRW